MTTIRDLAAEYAIQPYEVAAGLDLGADWTETGDLAAATEREYREVLDILAADAADRA
jgi:type IV secretory pathway VirD2 relaxase